MRWPSSHGSGRGRPFLAWASSTAANRKYLGARGKSCARLPFTASGGNRGRVALIADSGGLYALYDSRDKNHRLVREAVRAEAGPIIVPVAILAELDYL